MKVAGLLLAGGRSRRFGSEKSVAPFGAGLLMDRPLAALNAVCGRVAVSVRRGSGADAHAAVLELPRLIDASDDPEGPLAGIRRGIDWAEEAGFDWLAVAPCDAPTLKGAPSFGDRQIRSLSALFRRVAVRDAPPLDVQSRLLSLAIG